MSFFAAHEMMRINVYGEAKETECGFCEGGISQRDGFGRKRGEPCPYCHGTGYAPSVGSPRGQSPPPCTCVWSERNCSFTIDPECPRHMDRED